MRKLMTGDIRRGSESMRKLMTGDIRRGSKSRMRRWRKFTCGGTTSTVSGTMKSRPTLVLLFLNTALVFLKLFDKVYAPLTAGLLHLYRGDRTMAKDRLQQLDRLYQSVTAAL